MLIVLWPDPVHHLAGFEHVFLAEQLARLHMSGISAQHLAGKALAVLLVHSAWFGVHSQQLAALVVFFFRLGYRSQQGDSQHIVKSHCGSTPSGTHEIGPCGDYFPAWLALFEDSVGNCPGVIRSLG